MFDKHKSANHFRLAISLIDFLPKSKDLILKEQSLQIEDHPRYLFDLNIYHIINIYYIYMNQIQQYLRMVIHEIYTFCLRDPTYRIYWQF